MRRGRRAGRPDRRRRRVEDGLGDRRQRPVVGDLTTDGLAERIVAETVERTRLPRRSRQQRRARARRRSPRHDMDNWRRTMQAERRGAVPVVQGGSAGDARRERRLDRQCLLDRGDRRPPEPLLLRDLESGPRGPQPEHRDRLRPPRDPLQLRLARLDRERALPRVREGLPRAPGGASSPTTTAAASGVPRRSPPAASTCCPTTRASSTAPTTSSTAAGRPQLTSVPG